MTAPERSRESQHGQSDEPAAPSAARLHLWQVQGVRDALVILSVALLVYVGYAMRSVTVPLLIALALAYLFEPVVQRLTRLRNITRPGAVLIILLTGGVTVTAVLLFTVPRAISETIALTKQLRSETIAANAEKAIGYLPEDVRKDAKQFLDWLTAKPEKPAAGVEASKGEEPKDAEPKKPEPAPIQADSPAEDERIREIVREEIAAQGVEPVPSSRANGAPWRLLGALGTTAEYAGGFLFGLLELFLLAFLVPFYFYFFSVSFPSLVEFGRSLIPERNRGRAIELVALMDRAVSGFVRGRIVIALIMGVLFALGWRLCGVPSSIALGLFVGLLSLVPYLGGIGVPLAVGLLLIDQSQLHESERMAVWGMFVWPTVVFIVVQSIEGWILTPVIAGKATDLDPVTIVVAILAGGGVAGVYGMLLAIPTAACGKILLKEVLLPRIRAWSRGEAPDPLSLDQS